VRVRFGRDDVNDFEKDYIKRQLQRLSEALARVILGARETGKIDPALEEIKKTCRSLIGHDARFLAVIDAGSAALVLREPSKIKAYAELCAAEGELLALRGDAAAAEAMQKRARELEELAKA